MNRYQFSQQVKINDKVFPVGVSSVPEELEESRDFLHFVKSGYITEAGPEKSAPAAKDLQDRNEKLAKKIQDRLEKKENDEVNSDDKKPKGKKKES